MAVYEVDNEAGINNGEKVDVVEGEMEDFISALPCLVFPMCNIRPADDDDDD